jgi:phosphatidylinositol-bisphosphatase
MKIKSTTICFVCAHLAAGQSNVNDRIDDYHDITKGIVFGRGTARAPHEDSNGKGMSDGTLCSSPL